MALMVRSGMRCWAWILVFAVVLGVSADVAVAQPSGFVDELVSGGWNNATGLTFTADGDMIVWEKAGRLWLVEDGEVHDPPLLDISDEVGDWRDYGLLGVALHPAYLDNGYIYLLYVVDRHHLLNAGTPSYDPDADDYFSATIGRVTRYTADLTDDLHSVVPGSRLVLIGDDITNGIPIVHQSHGVGSILFGEDGTLLISTGDAASYSAVDTGGSTGGSYAVTAVADGILTDKENVGSYRSQLIDSHCGKILRIDPATGEGLPSNPFYDAAAPSAPRSRVWALGFRNPCRMSMRPESGDHDPTLGEPGVLYVGDVGWDGWEELDVVTAAGQNFGWPVFEGMGVHFGYQSQEVPNLDAVNPEYDGGACDIEHFYFRDLIQQDTLAADPEFENPCDDTISVPATIPTFLHTRPAIDWGHGSGPSRTATFSGDTATATRLDAVGSPVPGPNFGGNCAMGGVWYTGTDYPEAYRDRYFIGDFTEEWIRVFEFDAANQPVSAANFATGIGSFVAMAADPVSDDLFYIRYGSEVRRIRYAPGGNLAPVALVDAEISYGATPLTVHFHGDASTDPNGDALTYLWDFGDGSPTSAEINPEHTFTAPAGVPTQYDVTLTVSDPEGLTGSATWVVSLENTPPAVAITSPVDYSVYSMTEESVIDLTADVTDAEHSGAELTCEWQTFLHHNSHNHPEPIDTACTTTATISPAGCDGQTYYYRVRLTVTDAAGLSASDEVRIYPDCATNEIPLAVDDTVALPQGFEAAIDVLANDRDLYGAVVPSTVSLVTPPTTGSVDFDPETGVATYTHDGSTSTADSFTYTVEDNVGALSNVATVTVSAFNIAPVVTIVAPTVSDTFTFESPVTLTASGYDAQDGDTLTIDWQIDRIHGAEYTAAVYTGSGATPAPFVPATVGAPGDHVAYWITVTATDVSGATATATRRLLPSVLPANATPVAAFTATPMSGAPPLTVTLDASATDDADGDHLTLEWDLGDGTSATGESVVHDYPAVGSYPVTLTVTDGLGATDTTSTTIEVAAPGLAATYFDTISLGEPALTRIDSTIDFDWGFGSPHPSIAPDTFSVRWEGRIESEFSEEYTFTVTTDDGFRLWIDGTLVIDEWIDQAPTSHSGAYSLTADEPVSIVAEYYENGGGAVAELRWSSASTPFQIVPADRFSLGAAENEAPVASNDFAVVSYDDHVHVEVLANDTDEAGTIDPTSIVITTAPLLGEVDVEPSGEVVYTPTTTAPGNDLFRYTVADLDGAVSNEATVFLSIVAPSLPEAEFLRGDVDGSGSVFALVDAIVLLEWAFLGGISLGCEDAADVDANDQLEPLVDVVALLDWGFAEGVEPPAPGPIVCGPDPGADAELSCETASAGCE